MGSCLEPCFYIHLSNYFEIYTSFTTNEIRMYKYLSANPMLFVLIELSFHITGLYKVYIVYRVHLHLFIFVFIDFYLHMLFKSNSVIISVRKLFF